MSKKMYFSKFSIVSNNENHLKRSRIHNLLEEAIQKPAVTVIAGAGFGKTQAVYSFLQDFDVITTWQQLTSLDNISMRFWANLINVMSLHNKNLASNMEIIGFPDTSTKIDMFESFLADAGNAGKKNVIVFDDFHVIDEKKILLLMENIINACIPNFCIILISRNEPEINLIDLHVKNMIFTINEDNLRFNKNEMDLYFEMQDIHICPQMMSKIYENTNGWIFAIRLIELSIKQGVSHEEYAIEAMKLNIFKMMESKFFSDVSKEAQMLLIKLSLFQSLPSELVQLLSQNNKELIIEVLKINSFIRYDSFANTYCIHNLFLDFLKQKQALLTQNEKIKCYEKAAYWYASNGYEIDAINYFGQAGDYEKIIDIVLTLPYALPEEVAGLLLNVLNRAAEEAYEQQPLLTVLYARALSSIGRREEAMHELAELKKEYEDLPQTQGNRSLLCEIYIVEATINHLSCVFTSDFTFSDLYIKAYEYMPEESSVLKNKYNNQELGAYVCRVGGKGGKDIEDYIASVTSAIPYVSKLISGSMYGLDDLAKAEIAYFRNQMRSSESFAYSALNNASKKGQYEIESRALFYLLRVALSSGDYIKIKDLLKQLDIQFETKYPDHKMLYDIVTSWFYSTIGRGDMVAGWIKSNFVKSNIGLILSGLENLSKIKYYLSEKKYHTIFNFIENEENTFGIDCFILGQIALLAYKAVCLYHMGKQDDAIIFLQEAYHLAEPNFFTMQFIEFGNDMVSLTKFALKSKACTIPNEWLKNIFRKSSTYAKRVAYVASEHKKLNQFETDLQIKLTKKELEFLTDLCHGMSIAEIASNRGISKNYVNNRLQIIYSKLGAQNIKDAIHIATLMKLVK